jgi:hypothetical protein
MGQLCSQVPIAGTFPGGTQPLEAGVYDRHSSIRFRRMMLLEVVHCLPNLCE